MSGTMEQTKALNALEVCASLLVIMLSRWPLYNINILTTSSLSSPSPSQPPLLALQPTSSPAPPPLQTPTSSPSFSRHRLYNTSPMLQSSNHISLSYRSSLMAPTRPTNRPPIFPRLPNLRSSSSVSCPCCHLRVTDPTSHTVLSKALSACHLHASLRISS